VRRTVLAAPGGTGRHLVGPSSCNSLLHILWGWFRGEDLIISISHIHIICVKSTPVEGNHVTEKVERIACYIIYVVF